MTCLFTLALAAADTVVYHALTEHDITHAEATRIDAFNEGSNDRVGVAVFPG
jgi:hypothetical protein